MTESAKSLEVDSPQFLDSISKEYLSRRNKMLERIILFALALALCGCDMQLKVQMDPIALADQQRHKVMLQTREASYSVFPDTDDPKKLEDSTMLDAMRAVTPNGSAFAVRADGLVLTNMHVIEETNFCTGQANERPRSEEDMLREVGRAKEEDKRRENKKDTHCLFVTQSFTKVFRAKLVKIDKGRDIATLCLLNAEKNTPFLELALSGGVVEGAEVITIGSPLGNMNMMTHGYISNLDFVQQDKETGKKGERKVQFSAHILPGNSGGPLVSVATGKVVGQVVAIVALAGGRIATGMSYANPLEDLRMNMANTPPCDIK